MKIFKILIILILTSCKVSNIETSTTSENTTNVNDSLNVPKIREYKELVQSVGDTAVTYDGDLIILDGRNLVSLGTTAWVNFKVVLVYK